LTTLSGHEQLPVGQSHPNAAELSTWEGDMRIRWSGVFIIAMITTCGVRSSHAGDLRITIPKRSHLTPVQRLNREGVEAVQKHDYEKAKALFYRAYLFDPGDPFTLNNLGYIAELEGQVERAQNFYSLVSGQTTEALIDKASSSKLEGESLQTAVNAVHDTPMQVNRANVAAIRLLSAGRPFEAENLLLRTLALDPHNGFTLNNLGVTKEAEGEYTEALKYYSEAGASQTDETVVVTMNAAWRGKPLREMAAESAKRLRSRMNTLQSTENQTALLNLRGVSALNRNDWNAAWQNFSQAYKLDSGNAFSLNNQGYMAELNGDLETAQEFYREAQQAGGAAARVGLATHPDAEGMRLYSVANGSEAQVSTAIETASRARRRNPGPIQLKRRDGSPVQDLEPPTTPPPAPGASPQ
jgi:Flp pilus assembly protein TadD